MNRERGKAIRWLADLCLDVLGEQWRYLRNVRRKNGHPYPEGEEYVIAVLEVAKILESGKTPPKSLADVIVHSPPSPREPTKSEALLDTALSLDAPSTDVDDGSTLAELQPDEDVEDPQKAVAAAELARMILDERDSFLEYPQLLPLVDDVATLARRVPDEAKEAAVVLRRLRDALDQHREDPALCAEILHQFGRRRRGRGAHSEWPRDALAENCSTSVKAMRGRTNQALRLVEKVRRYSLS
jgi:hypothetical protein